MIAFATKLATLLACLLTHRKTTSNEEENFLMSANKLAKAYGGSEPPKEHHSTTFAQSLSIMWEISAFKQKMHISGQSTCQHLQLPQDL